MLYILFLLNLPILGFSNKFKSLIESKTKKNPSNKEKLYLEQLIGIPRSLLINQFPVVI